MVDRIRLSKTVSHALRHAPWLYALEPDEEGWVAVSDLLEVLRERRGWQGIDETDLAAMVERSDKQRFELRDGRIRALYGHSLPGRLARAPALPPPVLYHGTSPGAARAILSTGLHPMGRQYVHLSADRATAVQVGRRKSREPIILTVDAGRAAARGIRFYRGNELVWLADAIPAEYISEGRGVGAEAMDGERKE